ncbi:TPA: hypothetical protein ACH3X1_003295 [Trebouxia sp. C0004]
MANLQARPGWQACALASTAKELLEQLTHHEVSSKIFHVGLQQAYLQHAALTTDQLAAIVQQSGLTQQQAEQGLTDLLTALPPAPTFDQQQVVSGRAGYVCTVLAAAIVRGAYKWTCKAPLGILADSLQQLVPELARSFERHICDIIEQLARATKQLLSAPCECSAHRDCAENCHFAAETKLMTAMSMALDEFPDAGSCCLGEGVLSCLSAAFIGSAAACQPSAIHILSSLLAAKTSLRDVRSTLYTTPEASSPRQLLGSTNVGLASVIDAALGMLLGSATSGTGSASLCDRLSLSANMMLLNHQPADQRVAAFMLRMIAQALHVQLAGFPLPEDSTHYSAARAAMVNTQSAALMQPTDDDITMGISTLAVIVLCLVDEEQGTFAPATLPSHDDIRWFTSMLLIKAFQQYAGHRLAGMLVILSAILQQQFGGNVFSFAQMHFVVSLEIQSASQQRQQQCELGLQARTSTAEVGNSVRQALCDGLRLSVLEHQQLQRHVMSWYANEARRGGSGSPLLGPGPMMRPQHNLESLSQTPDSAPPLDIATPLDSTPTLGSASTLHFQPLGLLRPNTTATLDARIASRSRARAAITARAQLLSSSSSQMNLASSLLTDSSGGQQASAVHMQPGLQGINQLTHLLRSGAAPANRMLPDHSTQNPADVLMQVRARQLQRNTATAYANWETEQHAEMHWPPPLVVPDILEQTVEVPDAFKCPITLTYMREPASTREGLTYDRPAILRWIEQQNRDPKTAKKLRANHLSPNFSLRTAMQSWIDMQLHELGVVS